MYCNCIVRPVRQKKKKIPQKTNLPDLMQFDQTLFICSKCTLDE